MNQKIVVTINREYGSGGRNIGRLLAASLGIEYYDRDLLRLASESSGINQALFENADEAFRRTSLFRAASAVYRGELLPPDSDDFTSTDNLFNYQAKVIKELAANESCIIIGRCADFILEDQPNLVRVFIEAPSYYLLYQASLRKSLPPRELQRYVEKINRNRADYYRYHTGREWTDVHHYDLCLDSSKISPEKAVEIIRSYMKVRFDGLEL